MATSCCNSKVKRCCRHANLTNIGFVLSVLSIISSAITIIYFTIEMNNLEVYDYLYQYTNATCIPVNGVATNMTSFINNDKHCPNPWIMMFVLDNGLKAITNPFAGEVTRIQAIDDRNKLVLGNNYSCLCRSSTQMIINDCSVWPSCIFNSEFVKFMQRDNDRYYRTYVSFIIASAISSILSIIAIPSTISLIYSNCRRSLSYTELE